MASRADAEKKKRDAVRKQAQISDESAGKVPRELREKLKKAKAAKGLLKDLEEQVRVFVRKWEETNHKGDKEPELDSEDEEIVFVGRNGQMNDMPPSPQSKQSPSEGDVERDRLVFESLANDQGASFGWVSCNGLLVGLKADRSRRWLVHSIASYYGLRTWSVTKGDPARREAYVGILLHQGNGRPPSPVLRAHPLWGMV